MGNFIQTKKPLHVVYAKFELVFIFSSNFCPQLWIHVNTDEGTSRIIFLENNLYTPILMVMTKLMEILSKPHRKFQTKVISIT